jgi:hypothetical protein
MQHMSPSITALCNSAQQYQNEKRMVRIYTVRYAGKKKNKTTEPQQPQSLV